MWSYPENATITKHSIPFPKHQKKERCGKNNDKINATYENTDA